MTTPPPPQSRVPASCSHTWRQELLVNSTSLLSASRSNQCATSCTWAKYRPYNAVTSPQSGVFLSTIPSVPITWSQRPWGRGEKPGVAHWPAPPPSRPHPTAYPSRRVPVSCNAKCGPYFGDRPPTMLVGMDDDALGPPCLPGQDRPLPSSLSGVGGSVNGKLGTIRHRRSHGTSSSPSTCRGPMENKGWSYVLRRCSNSGPRACYPWSRVPSQKHRPSPWTGTTAMPTSDPPHPFPASGYWGPLASLVEYSELPAWPPYCPGDLQLSGSFDHVAGRRRKIRVPVRPRCRLKAALKQRRVPVSDPNTSQAHGNMPPAALAALRVPTRHEKCAHCGAEWAAHLDQAARLFSSHKRVPYVETYHLLHLWWSEVTKWVCDRPNFLNLHIDRDLSLAQSVLHHLATSGPPDSASSPHLGSKDDVTLETAAKGIGPAGSVHVPPDLWDTWADPLFEAAGRHAPSQPPTACPKAAAMLRALFHDGLLAPTQDPANAQVFVK